MVLEWIRSKKPKLDKELCNYLFSNKPVAYQLKTGEIK